MQINSVLSSADKLESFFLAYHRLEPLKASNILSMSLKSLSGSSPNLDIKQLKSDLYFCFALSRYLLNQLKSDIDPITCMRQEKKEEHHQRYTIYIEAHQNLCKSYKQLGSDSKNDDKKENISKQIRSETQKFLNHKESYLKQMRNLKEKKNTLIALKKPVVPLFQLFYSRLDAICKENMLNEARRRKSPFF